MTEFAVVIPVGPGRRENLREVSERLQAQTLLPKAVVVVYDGCKAEGIEQAFEIEIEKHQPGMEQPRNVGARFVENLANTKPDLAGITHLWFLDSDIIFEDDCLAQYEAAISNGGARGVYYGPYEWLPPGLREVDPGLRNDPRTEMFLAEQEDRDQTSKVWRHVNDLSKGLGCFSGNLVWNLCDFTHVGGFWNELHHGRCEDGELGLRAVAMDVPIGLVPLARGYHLAHEINMPWALQANTRDVPMLNARHPWVEGRCTCTHESMEHAPEKDGAGCRVPDCNCDGFTKAMLVVEHDGKRFDARCACGWEGNTALIWSHQAECPAGPGPLTAAL